MLIFYRNTVAIDRNTHRHTRLATLPSPFGFAAGTNSVLLAGREFAAAALSYPIVFVGDRDKGRSAAALLGLRDAENLFVDASGRWSAGDYIPAFVRRYPFVLAEEEGVDRYTVCMDAACPGFGEGEGERLFEDDGSESAYLQRNIDFMLTYRAEMARTAGFARMLDDLELLVPKTVAVEHAGARHALEGFLVVDEARFAALGDDQVLALWKQGYLPWVIQHLGSLQNVARLASRLERSPTDSGVQ